MSNKDEPVYRRFSEVVKYLDKIRPTQIFRSSAPNYTYIDHPDIDNDLSQNFNEPQKALPFLLENKIDAILSFNFHPYAPDDIAQLEQNKIVYKHLPVADFRPPSSDTFRETLKFIEGKKRVLIHCGYGAGRTGTAITAIQLHCTKGANPPKDLWGEVEGGNDVEIPSQIASLEKWIQDGCK